MSTLETIKEKIEAIKQQKEELTAQLRKDFAPMLQPLFEKSNGKIKSIGWTQYTPYFNDGDTCEFGINIDYPYVNGESVYDLEILNENKHVKITEENEEEVKKHSEKIGYRWLKNNTIGQGGYLPNENYDQELDSLVEEFKSVLSSIDDEFYKDLFGDHVIVTVHSNGTVETEQYEHD